jgi:hypothetical protein
MKKQKRRKTPSPKKDQTQNETARVLVVVW